LVYFGITKRITNETAHRAYLLSLKVFIGFPMNGRCGAVCHYGGAAMLDRQCNIRLSESFLMQLQDCADLEQLSVSEYIRLKMQGVVVRNRRKHFNARKGRVSMGIQPV
jgi:hypothetical protein